MPWLARFAQLGSLCCLVTVLLLATPPARGQQLPGASVEAVAQSASLWRLPPTDTLPPIDPPVAETTPAEFADKPPEPRNYYVEPRSYGTRLATEPPRYVRTLSETDVPAFEHLDWLDVGLDQRTRYEYRDDDLRRPIPGPDHPLLLRVRSYLGIHDRFDPFRGYIEFEDARRYNSRFPLDDRDTNETEIIQAVGELYFADALGCDRPFRLQFGRMAFEYTDRRLVARNEWRNTTNNFQGFRAIMGQQQNDWQLDLLALQPVERRPRRPDVGDEESMFYGAIFDWRRWSEVVTFQPYYLFRDQSGKHGRLSREIHTMPCGYGIVGTTGFDYDFDLAFQAGNYDAQRHRALGFTTELGYTFEHQWKPRLSAFFGYASGDREPNDGVHQRFDRLFGFARPWSANDYFVWENIMTPKTRLEFQPHEKTRVDLVYSAYWLASDTDFWVTSFRHDPTGQSGDFVGHELDIRIQQALTPHVDVTLGYAYFLPGNFVRNTGRSDDTDFFYVEVSTRLFK